MRRHGVDGTGSPDVVSPILPCCGSGSKWAITPVDGEGSDRKRAPRGHHEQHQHQHQDGEGKSVITIIILQLTQRPTTGKILLHKRYNMSESYLANIHTRTYINHKSIIKRYRK